MRTKNAIYQDYPGPSPIFDNTSFQWIFQISLNVYDLLKTSLQEHSLFNVEEYIICGRPNICNNAKILFSLKHLGYGCSMNAWRDYFQMGESAGQLAVEMFCLCIAHNPVLHACYLYTYTEEDAKHVSLLHEDVHGIPGMLGLLDCMHLQWKSCSIGYQGAYQGKEKFSTLVLEAITDHNLWFWHAAFGFTGSCNDINILDVSPLHQQFLDGSHSKIDFEFTIDE